MKKTKPGFQFKVRPDGYTRSTVDFVRKMNHVWEWEKHFGPVPKGYHVHHKNGVRSDNRIENLQIMKPMEHKRAHAGCYKKKGKWIKPCPMCRRHFPLTTGFYNRKDFYGAPDHACKKCTTLRNLLHRNRKKLQTAKAQIEILTQKLKERRV